MFDSKMAMKLKMVEGLLNTPNEVILENVRENLKLNLPQLKAYQPNPEIALLVCSGPSLEETEDELVEALWRGGKIVAVNGAYNWCIERNLKPSCAILLDARESNARFFEREVPGCRYLVASQCHPKAFETVKGRDVTMWHAVCTEAENELIKDYFFETASPVQGGTTVGIRAILILRMLGFVRMEIFGMDSCFLDGKHHSFDQEENAKDKGSTVWLRPEGRDDLAEKFVCAPWHMKQINDFQELINKRGNLFQLHVHGRGLLSAILRAGAKIHLEEQGNVALPEKEKDDGG